MDRKGNVLEGTISIFSDFHVLQGVAEYLKIEEVRTPENMELLKTCYETMEKMYLIHGLKKYMKIHGARFLYGMTCI